MNSGEMKLWYLKNLDIFKGLSGEELHRLKEGTVMKNYKKKEYLFFSSDNINDVYIIKKGNVEIGHLDMSGREFSIDILTKGEIFGAVLGKGFAGGYARAIDRALVCIMDRKEFEEMLEKSPKLSLRVLKLLGFKINILENKLQHLVFKDVKTRICELLKTLYVKSGDKETGEIKISLTHQDIANLVGSTRETTSVYLAELRREGVIEYERKKIKIISLSALQELIAAPA